LNFLSPLKKQLIAMILKLL